MGRIFQRVFLSAQYVFGKAMVQVLIRLPSLYHGAHELPLVMRWTAPTRRHRDKPVCSSSCKALIVCLWLELAVGASSPVCLAPQLRTSERERPESHCFRPVYIQIRTWRVLSVDGEYRPKGNIWAMRFTGVRHARACLILGTTGTFRQDIPKGACRLTPENVSSQLEM